MAVARETLSPLLRSTQVRRLSLELCQKLLTPSNSPNGSPSNTPVASPRCTNADQGRRGSITAIERALASIQVSDGVSPGFRPRRFSLIQGYQTTQKISNEGAPSIQVLSPSPEKGTGVSKPVVPAGRRNSYGSLLFNSPSLVSHHIRQLEGESPDRVECPFSAPVQSGDSLDSVQPGCTCPGKPINYSEEQVLGRGSFGVVFRGSFHGRPAAVKLINCTSDAHKDSALNEKHAIGLSHQNIAQVMNITEINSQTSMIVIELLQKDNLHKILLDPDRDMDFHLKIRLCGQIASALAYCHEKGILHLDVKPQNVLLDEHGNCKLSDFGTSKSLSENRSASHCSKWLEGTVAYKAPELFRGQIPTDKCDVYSYGICMWQILHREEPYSNLNDHAVIYQVVAAELRPQSMSSDENNNVSETSSDLRSFVDIYKSCWETDPLIRPSMKQVVDKLLLLFCSV